MPTNPDSFNYTKRARFFAKKVALAGGASLVGRAKKWCNCTPKNCGLSDFPGVSPEAFSHVSKSRLDPRIIFASPGVLTGEPLLTGYYRCISTLPHKGMSKLSGTTYKRVEEGGGAYSFQSDKSVTNFCREVNKVISEVMLTLNYAEITEAFVAEIVSASLGVTYDGSWRNQIGQDGEILVKKIVLNYFKSISSKSECHFKGKTRPVPTDGVSLDAAGKLWMVSSVGGNFRVEFSSEPDVSIYKMGKLVGVIEVKAGTDPAGLFERHGAMIKSFQEVKRHHPDALTLLITSIVNDEIRTRHASEGIPFLLIGDLEEEPKPVFDFLDECDRIKDKR
jgi:hypothetical protein